MSNRFFPNYPDYIITSRFGMRTMKGVTKMHKGIDLVATKDGRIGQIDKIMAHTGGTVCAVGYGDSAGYYIKIQADPDTVMVYYHLKALSPCKEGDTVRKGDTIGTMGATGNVTGAHLHWGIKRNGEWIDPEPYLDKDYPVAAPTPGGTEPTKYLDFRLPVLKRGMKGGSVWAMQALLIGYGYDLGGKGLDGSFGAATEAALRKYQLEHDLEVDGSCGRQTWNSLLGLEG